MLNLAIAANDEMTRSFHLIVLEGYGLRGTEWTPGQKLRILMGSFSLLRSYMPIEANPSAGRLCILGYAGGSGLGSRWLRRATRGMACVTPGLQASLNPDLPAGMLAFFGDETSIRLAYALVQRDRMAWFVGGFEVDDITACRSVLDDLAPGGSEVIAREPDDRHLNRLAQRLPGLAEVCTFVLTGKESTVRQLRRRIRLLEVPAERVVTQTHWA